MKNKNEMIKKSEEKKEKVFLISFNANSTNKMSAFKTSIFSIFCTIEKKTEQMRRICYWIVHSNLSAVIIL